MKVVHICLIFTNGLGYQENLLAKYHSQLGLDVEVLSSKWVYNSDGVLAYSDTGRSADTNGVRVTRLEIRKKRPYQYRFKRFVGFYEALEESRPDILFVHGCQFLDVDRIVKYLKSHPDVTVYLDNHADFSNSATNWLSKNLLHKMAWRWCAHQIEPYVEKFYGVLPARVDFLTDVYSLPREKCELLVMGADDELVERARRSGARARIRAQHGIGEDDFLVITGGKIDRWKTQTLLLMEAVQNISSDRLRLIVFGSIAPELADLVNRLTDGVRIQSIGWISSEDTYYYLEAADLAVFPGRHSVLWEQAAGQGVPMLVKDWPGTHHVDLGGNVRFLVQDSAAELQREIERLLEDPSAYQGMKAVAESRGMQAFSYREIAKRSIRLDGPR